MKLDIINFVHSRLIRLSSMAKWVESCFRIALVERHYRTLTVK